MGDGGGLVWRSFPSEFVIGLWLAGRDARAMLPRWQPPKRTHRQPCLRPLRSRPNPAPPRQLPKPRSRCQMRCNPHMAQSASDRQEVLTCA
jgi:hypothetical protein